MSQYVANKNVFSERLKLSLPTAGSLKFDCQAESFIPTDRPRQMPFGRRCWACTLHYITLHYIN